jgi:DNA-binding CsgD family transcriptional regulator
MRSRPAGEGGIIAAMHELTNRDYRDGWRLVCSIAEAARDAVSFAHHGVAELPRLVASEITTLSVCDLAHGRRSVIGNPEGAISATDRACFDRYFESHPLVRYHSGNPRGVTARISDLMPAPSFRESGLFNDNYRKIGIDHAVAVPLLVDRNLLVSFVLNHSRSDFSERERAFLDLVREPLSALYRNLVARGRGLGALATLPVTAREREVLSWLAAGKTDREIGEILGMRTRTVQKHLQHIYEKLGVETRTAAVMRAMQRTDGTGTGPDLSASVTRT